MRTRGIFIAGALLVAVPFLPTLLNPEMAFLFRDISNVWLPYKATWVAAVTELGRIPHWDPLHAAGSRFIADVNYGPLYPLNWMLIPLARLAGMVRAFTFFLFVHHLLIYAGAFLLLRDLRVRPVLALAGGLAAAWSGMAMSADCLEHLLGAEAAAPFFFLFWRRALRRGDVHPYLFAASLALAWPVYSGEPQASYLLAIAAMVMAARARAREVFLLLPLAALAAAPQLLPTAHYLAHAKRILEHADEAEKLAWSLHPLRFLETFFPLAFGSDPRKFRAAELLGGAPIPFVFSFYAGAIPALFAASHLFLNRRRRRGYALFAVLLLLAFGSFSPVPLYALFGKVLPLWGGFRFPERLGIWTGAAILLFGMSGLEKVLRLPRADRALGFGFTVLAALGLALCLGSPQASVQAVARTLVFAAAAIAALRFVPRRLRAPVLTALLVADMALIARELVWAQPVALTEPASYPWAGKILAAMEKDKGGTEGQRFFSGVEKPVLTGRGDLEEAVHSVWAGMKFNAPSLWGIPLVRGHTSMTPDRPVLHLTGISPEMADRALDLFGARYFLSPKGNEPVAVLRPSALPRAVFPAEMEPIRDEAALSARLADPRWNPRRSVLVESGENTPPAPDAPVLAEVDQRWDTIRLRATTREASPPRWLLLNEAYDPLWRARLNGRELRTARANGWAIGVLLPAIEAGDTIEVDFTYTDVWYEAGLAALLVWAALFALSVRRSARPRSGSPARRSG